MKGICYEGQPFGGNYNPSYSEARLSGHTGQDWSCGYGTPIHSPFDGHVYKVLTAEKPSGDGSGFTGIFMIIDNGIELFEFLVGHCDPAVVVGQNVRKGDVIGTEANHGTVYAGPMLVTLEMQAAGNHDGSHRHYQKRPVFKSKTLTRPCLSSNSDLNGAYLDAQGFYYPIWDYGNGYNGCVDPVAPTFARDLTFGRSGYDVFVLQRFLATKGFLHADPTGFFGELTRDALSEYQKVAGIAPTIGYFGPMTRKHLLADGALIPAPVLSVQ